MASFDLLSFALGVVAGLLSCGVGAAARAVAARPAPETPERRASKRRSMLAALDPRPPAPDPQTLFDQLCPAVRVRVASKRARWS